MVKELQAGYRAAFSLVDLDKSGVLSSQELSSLFTSFAAVVEAGRAAYIANAEGSGISSDRLVTLMSAA